MAKKINAFSNKSNHKSKGGDKHLYFNDDVPFDTNYHGDMPKNLIKNHVGKINIKNDRIKEELIKAEERLKGQKQRLHENKINQDKIDSANAIKNKQISSKIYIANWKIRWQFVQNIFTTFGKLLSAFISILGELINKLLAGLGKFTDFISKDFVLGLICFIISIILILQFVFGYVVPLPEFTYINKNMNSQIVNNDMLAEKKLEYHNGKPFFDNFNFQFSSFLNAFVNIKRLYYKTAKYFGNDGMLNQYITDRNIDTDGRWDNMYNQQLGILTDNLENVNKNDDVYSIVKPKELELHLENVYNPDLYSLPPSIIKDIIKDKKTLKFPWELYNDGEITKYRMKCNPKDENNKDVILYDDIGKECKPKIEQYINENDSKSNNLTYYDTDARRGNKVFTLDNYISK
jgi:hypothetical protein